MARVPLFVSYSHEDVKWLELLTDHLASLENDGLIEVWDDRDIRAASEKTWEDQLLPKLEDARVIVLLLSPAFARSRYCQTVELPRAIQRKQRGEALVFFVLARSYDIEESVRRYQVLPAIDQSLKQARDRDAALAHIAGQIRKALEEFRPPQRAVSGMGRLSPMLPPYLPYLCDRTEQEDPLHLLFDEPAERRKRPLVYLLAGPNQECHEAFHERMARDLLPGLVGLAQSGPSDPLPLEWPDGVWPDADWERLISIRLGRALGILASSSASVLRLLPDGLTFVATTMDGENWGSAERARAKAFLSYWNAWPDLEGNRALAVAISIVSQRGSPSSSELNETFPASDYPGIRFRVLPDLKSPQELHARNWLSHPKVKQFYRWDLYREPLRDRIHEIFRERGAIPMRELAGPLLAALQAYE